ncbi:MAG: DUF2293 domain-containing protein [Fuerstiella sp.]|nr:DUF2293 domain-containing protein [Fuerstiella sp.]
MSVSHKRSDVRVFVTDQQSLCAECQQILEKSAWVMVTEESAVCCLSCAGLDHLVFLPAGNPAMTRRAKKQTVRYAVVFRRSHTRPRYERHGLLVEKPALHAAEQQCIADADVRKQRQKRNAFRREALHVEYLKRFAEKVRMLYPGVPYDRSGMIASHACRRSSRRVGRSRAAKALSNQAVTLAVVAHVRHTETIYDQMLADGIERCRARQMVRSQVTACLQNWAVQRPHARSC